MRISGFLVLLLALSAAGQTPPDQRSTPRSAVFAYLDACRQGDFRRAASFLNLERAGRKPAEGPDVARDLKDILDRRLTTDPGTLSNAPEGDLNDGLDPEYELLGTIRSGSRTVDLLLERVSREESQVWLISSGTVRLIPALHSEIGSTWAEQHLPRWTLRTGPLDTAWWQWFGLMLLLGVAFGIAAVLARLCLWALRPVLAFTATQLDNEVVASIVIPMQVLLALAAFEAGLAFIGPPVILRTYLTRAITGLGYLALAWLAMRIIDVTAAQAVLRMRSRQRASATSVVPLARRSAKVAAVIAAILATLSSWGYDTTAVLAGLGVGGLAVALAAQKTIENLFGGVAVTTDRPVLVGEFCRYGDRFGTVEDIGLRSTRIRTLDRTVVTIPNAQFSSMEIENFGRRDKIFLHPILKLRSDTTPEQIRNLISRIRDILLTHPQVDPDPARVRFIGIGQYSLDIEVFAYVKTTNGDEFLIVQEQVMLAVLDAIHEAGTALAVPWQSMQLRTASQS